MQFNGVTVFNMDTFGNYGPGTGDYYDGEVVSALMGLLPPACMRPDCAQLGEPYAMRWDDEEQRYRPTYITLTCVKWDPARGPYVPEAVWKYVGDCFQGEAEQRGEKPPVVPAQKGCEADV